jgi:glycosyltransferase involved in cell wall biosynthesis
MKISVIITVYNLENFIAKSIESVLNQTEKAHEIIVIDDGSKDKSVEIIEQYTDRVRLIKMVKNSGVLPAFIKGLKHCSGDILAFLDGDDIWKPDKLEKIMNVFIQYEDVMLVTHLHEWIDNDGNLTNKVDETHKNLKRLERSEKDLVKRDRLLKNSILCYKGVWLGSAFSIRRSVLDLNEFEHWVASLPGIELSHQDQPLAAYLIYKNPDKKIYFLNEVLFQYRVYATNSSGSSVTVNAALLTLSRSIATISRTKNIVERNPLWKEEIFHQRMKLLELEFYRDLYSKKIFKAVKSYFKLFFTFWNTSNKIKETKRLFACLFLGPEKFLHLKSRSRKFI